MPSTPFRIHTTDPAGTPRTSGRGNPLITGLCDEWIRLCALPTAGPTLQRWAATEPALVGVTGLGDLLDRTDSALPDRQDQRLLALLRLAQTGQQLAARVVLQAMLPKLARIVASRGTPFQDRDDAMQDAVAAMWEVITGYPVTRRPHRVAANLALDTLHELTRESRRPSPTPVDPQRLNDQLDQPEPHADIPAEEIRAELVDLISWGVRTAVINSGDGALLLQVYASTGSGVPHVARQHGISTTALRQRCSRARRRLTTALSTHIDRQPPLAIPA